MAERQYRSQQVGLADADRKALAKLSGEQGKTNSEVARDAIRWYLHNHEAMAEAEKDERLAKVMYKCTDRICALMVKCTNRVCGMLVRIALDTNMVFMLFYRYLPADKADEISAKMYRMAVSRLLRKLSPQELDIEKMIQEGLEQGTTVQAEGG